MNGNWLTILLQYRVDILLCNVLNHYGMEFEEVIDEVIAAMMVN